MFATAALILAASSAHAQAPPRAHQSRSRPKMSHEEAGRNILRMLALGPSGQPDAQAKAAFLLARYEAKDEVDSATAGLKESDPGDREKRKVALNDKRTELAENLRAFEFRLKKTDTVSPLDAFEAIKMFEERDFLDTIGAELEWEAVLNSARRVKALLLKKAGPKGATNPDGEPIE